MNLSCPICKVALSQRSVVDQTIDQCDVCNGVWYDPSELSSLLRNSAVPDLLDHECQSPSERISCPKCETEITATIYAHDSGISVLKCASCLGVWLAAGQFEEIFLYRNGSHKTDKLVQPMAESGALSNTLDRIAGLIQSRLLSAVFVLLSLIVAALCGAGGETVFRLLASLVLPLVCIWFSDAMGNVSGIGMGLASPKITKSTPGIAVAIGGWILMFAVFGVMIYANVVH